MIFKRKTSNLPPLTKLWLDDQRDPHRNGRIDWKWVRSYDECIEFFLSHPDIYQCSLDHDLVYPDHLVNISGGPDNIKLMNDEKTGFHVLLWMESNNIWPHLVDVHTASSWGRKRMIEVLERNERRYRALLIDFNREIVLSEVS